MTQQTMMPQMQAQQQVQKQQKTGLEVLKGMLNAESVKEQFQNALGKSSTGFIASIIDLYNNDANIMACEPKAIVMECLKAAVLKLPINKNLGYAYIIAYRNGRTGKSDPQFQMGYRGYIQLAMRTSQYRIINADVVYEGELTSVNKLTGEIAFDGTKKSDKVVGYFAHFELLNGFSKTLYVSVEDMAVHAKRYSKSVKKDTTVEKLIALANTPVSMYAQVGWEGNFEQMALKTVIRNLLSKYGYLSIEMQEAYSNDMDADIASNQDAEPAKVINMQEVAFEEVTEAPKEEKQEAFDPGF